MRRTRTAPIIPPHAPDATPAFLADVSDGARITFRLDRFNHATGGVVIDWFSGRVVNYTRHNVMPRPHITFRLDSDSSDMVRKNGIDFHVWLI